ncbi:MAG: (2Fe-2S)-binding protein [Deltaproteobacteria bacterium]|nr:(2Fe-2S)-binding protein [Deltaproteobacteria bacterium]
MLYINIKVNGKEYELGVKPYETLLETLRDKLGLTGTKLGCGDGECGACTVNLNGKAVLSCLTLVAQTDEKEILTIEGLQNGAELHPIQESFVENSAIQCGYCTPGLVMSAKALLEENGDPTDENVREKIANNLCRCTGYEQPVRAILEAAKKIRGENDR